MAEERASRFSTLSNQSYDLLIIGGGINGAGIARDAAMRGCSVLLCEKNDFASGTSSRSTKLIHGGLRYLERGRVGLVRQSLRERATLLRTAPHLVRPLSLVFPAYRGNSPSRTVLRLGMMMYDLLAGSQNIARHVSLDAGEIAAQCPGLSTVNLLGGVLFYDAQMDDARLCLETILDAETYGAVCLNYTEAIRFVEQSGSIRGAVLRDRSTGSEIEARAKATVVAVGPWTPRIMEGVPWYRGPRLRLSKGVHLVLNRVVGGSRGGRNASSAIIAPGRSRGRVFFVIPYGGRSLIGTTDHPFSGDPGRLDVSASERDELLADVNRLLEGERVTPRDIVSSFAGVRPLVETSGDRGTSEISRRHEIVDCGNGVWVVIGGKYTTYRAVAEELINRVARRLGREQVACRTDVTPIWGARGFESVDAAISALRRMEGAGALEEPVLRHLAETYGGKAGDVVALIREDRTRGGRLYPNFPHVRAEVVYAVRLEKALQAEDFIRRRSSLGLTQGTLPDGGTAVVDLMARELGWDARRIDEECESLTREESGS